MAEISSSGVVGVLAADGGAFAAHRGGADTRARPVVAVCGEAAAVTLHPLPADAVRIERGFWRDRRDANAQVSLEAGLRQLTAAGTLENFRLAADLAAGEVDAGTSAASYHGWLPFLDTDVFKWLEAVSWHMQHSPAAAEAWSTRADEVIGLVVAAQRPDGYLNTYTQVVRGGERWADLPSGHEMYCAGHLIQAAIAHRRATGRETLYGTAVRFADLLVAEFGADGRREGYCGHPEVETALVELYRESGRRDYLDLAARLVDRRGRGLLGDPPFGRRYFQDLEPVRQTTHVYGHAVRALYLAAGVADLYLETGEEALLGVLRAQWADLLAGKTYITGGTGARHRDEAFGDAFELPADQAYTETCAAIALMQLAWRMLLATGEAQYADVFERVLYNGFLAGVSLDGARFFYVNPLQVRPGSTLGPEGRQEWFSCACCPPNVMRTLASLPHYLATADAGGLQIHQYAAGSIRAVTPATGMHVGCDVETGYPYQGSVTLRIAERAAGAWTLSLRVPQWARDTARLRIDGQDVPAEEDGGYLRLARDWRGGESVQLDLPMPLRLTLADPRVDAARGCAAVERGPLVYCAEQADQDADTDLDRVAVAHVTGLGGTSSIAGVDVPVALLQGEQIPLPESTSQWPYRTARQGAAAEPGREVTVVAVPYFAWANRQYGAMRVWLPLSPVRQL